MGICLTKLFGFDAQEIKVNIDETPINLPGNPNWHGEMEYDCDIPCRIHDSCNNYNGFQVKPDKDDGLLKIEDNSGGKIDAGVYSLHKSQGPRQILKFKGSSNYIKTKGNEIKLVSDIGIPQTDSSMLPPKNLDMLRSYYVRNTLAQKRRETLTVKENETLMDLLFPNKRKDSRIDFNKKLSEILDMNGVNVIGKNDSISQKVMETQKTLDLFDIFSPDENSSRWEEFQYLLSDPDFKNEYDDLKRKTKSARGQGKYMTIGATHTRVGKRAGFPEIH